MKRIGLLHLLLSHPKKKKRDEDAGDDRSNDRRFFLGGANGEHDPHDHGAHPANDHGVHEVFKQRGVGFVSGDGLGLILGHGIDQVARPARELLIGVHPVQFLHQRLRLGIVLLPFRVENKIKSGNQIHDQQRRDKATEVKVDTAEFLHLVDFSGQRDANFLTDE